jgi:hypothetical protein
LPNWTSRFAVFVHDVATARPSTCTFDRAVSSPNARGRTDRLIELIPTEVVLRIVIVSAVEIVPYV